MHFRFHGTIWYPSQPRRTAQTVALTCCWHGQGSRLWLQISHRTRTPSFMIFHDLSWFLGLVMWQTHCHKATIWATLGDGLNPTHRNGDTVLGMVYGIGWTHIIPTIHYSSLIVSYTPIISHDVPISFFSSN